MPFTTQPLRVGVVGDEAVADTLDSQTEASEVSVISMPDPDDIPDRIDCLCVDQRYDSGSWPSALDRVTDRRPDLPVVALVEEQCAVATALTAGATDYLPRSLVERRPAVAVGRLETVVSRERDGGRTERLTPEYEQIFDGVNDAIVVFDPESGDIVDANESYHELLGYDDLETIRELGIEGLSITEEGYTAERGWRLIREVADTGEPRTVEWRGRTRDGETLWLEATLAPATIGGARRVLSIQRDVTDRKRRRREYEQIFDGVNDAIAVHDPETSDLITVNETLCELTGYDRETVLELGAEGLTMATEEFDPAEIPNIIRRVMDGEDVEPYEQAIETADGERRWLEVNPTRAVIDGEKRFLAISRDVTERRERQRRLEAERDRRSILFENTPDPIMAVEFIDGDPFIMEVNGAFETVFGFDGDAIADRPIADAVVPDSEREGYERIRQQAIAGEPVETEVRRQTAEGIRDFLLRVLPFEADGRRQAYVWYTDITERKRRELAIEEERQKYSTLVEQSTDGIVVVRDAEYVFVNEQFEQLTGYDREDLLGMSFEQVFTPECQEMVTDRYRRRIEGESPPDQYDLELQRPDGTRLTLETSVSRIRHGGEPATLATLRDVTERRERERAVEQLQSATERIQGAETREAVYDIAVETAQDVLDLPMTACWRHDGNLRRLEYVAGTAPVEEMQVGPVGFTPGDREYELFERGEATTYNPSDHHDHNPLTAAIVVPLGEHGLLAAGHERREEYETYLVDIMRVLAGHVATALERVANSKQLRENERRLQAIIDRIEEAIFLAPVGELTSTQPAPDFVSSGYEQIWGQPLEQLHETYEEGFFDTLHPEDDEEYQAFIERLVGAVRRGDADERYAIEYRIERPDGEIRWVHSDFYPTEWDTGSTRIVIVSRDVTDRKARERTLESFHDATAELTTADGVTEASTVAATAAADVFDMPAAAVYRYASESGELVPTATGPDAPDVAELAPLTDGDTAAWEAFVDETMRRVDVEDIPAVGVDAGNDALLLPLGGNGLLVVWASAERVDTEAATILAATLEAALNRLRGEQQLADRREELAAQTERAERLESITELTRRVEAAITTRSSRRGILEAVCEELVDVPPFTAAWTAAAEVGADQLTPRTVAGTTRDAVEQTLRGEPDRSDPHPAQDAWQRGETRVVDDLVGGSRRSDWRQEFLRSGAGSVCAVPLAYSGITYGVLTVITDEPDALSDHAVEVLSQLGTSVGYAITAIERQRALESDDTLELEFRGGGMDLPFARLAREVDSPVRLERTVRRQDGSVSVYYTLESEGPERLHDRAADVLPGDVTVVSQGEDRSVLERSGSSWFGSLISEYGGVLRRGRATPEGVELVVELPQEADTRTIVERIRDTYPALELTAQRQHREADMTPGEIREQLRERLSDRQYEALETGHAMGYFDWPRESSGEAVAAALGITQPTVNKHIRLGERKVFDLLFDPDT
ncbi:PAS domain S-box protein [Haloarcula sp. S1AR25-5A]|uniref:histidine kinase n=1 Tax=Haloarcula terrestris TaxID=2950533 RepID=A0AAE4EXY3_9EURY|nr:PAS domain S-box protein [Haloarcula terrestris]MDS0222295.1 PAS domain S-box protein [Haloarcula terrestris]